MKLGQLIERNIRNIFLEKSYTKCGGKTSPRTFSWKIENEQFLWIISLKYYKFVFITWQV